MDSEEKNTLKKQIESEITSTSLEIERLKELTKPIAPDNAIGRLSRMEAINEKSVKEANLRSAKVKLQKLKSSLSKIEDDSFGICTVCGDDIPTARLLARPESIRCVNCAE